MEEIEHEESQPQAVRILCKRGDEVVVVEEEDTTRELRRLESALSRVMKQIKVSTASRVLVFNVGDRSLSLSLCIGDNLDCRAMPLADQEDGAPCRGE